MPTLSERARELLFRAIEHGDEEHRAWLREAINAHFDGLPVPQVRGSGRKEARIAELETQLAALSSPIGGGVREGVIEECAAAVAAIESPFDQHSHAPENCAFCNALDQAEVAIRSLASTPTDRSQDERG